MGPPRVLVGIFICLSFRYVFLVQQVFCFYVFILYVFQYLFPVLCPDLFVYRVGCIYLFWCCLQ